MQVGDVVYQVRGAVFTKHKVVKVSPKTIEVVRMIHDVPKHTKERFRLADEGIISEGAFQGTFKTWTSKVDQVVPLVIRCLRHGEDYWNDVIYKAQERKDRLTVLRLKLESGGEVKDNDIK